jgi:hypothetical protein
MDALERLIAIEEIKVLEARRGRFLDTHQWDAYTALHTPEVMWKTDKSTETVTREARTEHLKEELEGSVSLHHVHSPDIEFSSPDQAQGIWAVEAMTTYHSPGRPAWRHGFGFYHVDYVRRGGKWLIAGRYYERLRVDVGGGPPD